LAFFNRIRNLVALWVKAVFKLRVYINILYIYGLFVPACIFLAFFAIFRNFIYIDMFWCKNIKFMCLLCMYLFKRCLFSYEKMLWIYPFCFVNASNMYIQN